MPPPVTIQLDSSRFEKAIRATLADSKRAVPVVMRQQAKLFVRDVVRITPPSHVNERLAAATDTTGHVVGAAAKKWGEATIRGDLSRIVQVLPGRQLARLLDRPSWEADFAHEGASVIGPIQHKVLQSTDELRKWHQSHRNKRGRVPKVNKRATTGIRARDLQFLDQAYVSPSVYKDYLKSVLARVGLLASGWCAAAARLGLALPAWITRHGSSRGFIVERIGAYSISITIANRVPFAGEVYGIERRMQSALDNRAKQLERVTARHHLNSARRAGFRATT